MEVDYFTKWVKEMPTFTDDGKTAVLFMFNYIIARFGVPKEIMIDHGSHFCNKMMIELSSMSLYSEPTTPLSLSSLKRNRSTTQSQLSPH